MKVAHFISSHLLYLAVMLAGFKSRALWVFQYVKLGVTMAAVALLGAILIGRTDLMKATGSGGVRPYDVLKSGDGKYESVVVWCCPMAIPTAEASLQLRSDTDLGRHIGYTERVCRACDATGRSPFAGTGGGQVSAHSAAYHNMGPLDMYVDWARDGLNGSARIEDFTHRYAPAVDRLIWSYADREIFYPVVMHAGRGQLRKALIPHIQLCHALEEWHRDYREMLRLHVGGGQSQRECVCPIHFGIIGSGMAFAHKEDLAFDGWPPANLASFCPNWHILLNVHQRRTTATSVEKKVSIKTSGILHAFPFSINAALLHPYRNATVEYNTSVELQFVEPTKLYRSREYQNAMDLTLDAVDPIVGKVLSQQIDREKKERLGIRFVADAGVKSGGAENAEEDDGSQNPTYHLYEDDEDLAFVFKLLDDDDRAYEFQSKTVVVKSDPLLQCLAVCDHLEEIAKGYGWDDGPLPDGQLDEPTDVAIVIDHGAVEQQAQPGANDELIRRRQIRRQQLEDHQKKLRAGKH